MMFLGNEELFSNAADVILETMQQSSYARYNTLRNDLLDCFSSDGMKSKLTTCIAGKKSLSSRPVERKKRRDN